MAILFCLLTSFSIWLVLCFRNSFPFEHYKVTGFISNTNYFG